MDESVNNIAQRTTAQNGVVALNSLVRIVSQISTTLMDINSSIVETFPNWVTAPANSTASGVAGQVAYSGSASSTAYFYACLTSGAAGSASWGRVQLTTGW